LFTHAVDYLNVIVAVLYCRNVIIILQSATFNTNLMHNEHRRGKNIMLKLVSTVGIVQGRQGEFLFVIELISSLYSNPHLNP